MAVYKVPQDVEAEDKLLGPFSFKQFVYLIIATLAIGIAYGLAQVLVPLAIIPLPVIIFFAALALPLRKDQPMEVYLAALVSFMTRPKVRIWRSDGIESLVEVVAPKATEHHLGKGYTSSEVQRRLSYLADIVDSEGWSVRGLRNPGSLTPSSILREDVYHEAQATNDLLDEAGDRSQRINNLLDKKSTERRQQLISSLQQPQLQSQPLTPASAPLTQITSQVPTKTITYDIPNYSPSDPYQGLVSPVFTPMSAIQPEDPEEDIRLVVNPYPSINQTVITPIGESPVIEPGEVERPSQGTSAIEPRVEPPTSVEPISPAIIDLANNHKDLSVETLSREANRIKQKELMLKENEEILISLR